ncbi:hypothetical protein [Vibrio caribbeanicus]|uniref:Uncharacterized protein n=1 Tax=Vibrio caribbeanicus ATCC BAA-2122 TaxID=796620 RepID=E3BED9_9VIBR|nr:hypothetical protein [Vibrio caribbeanicus]EFP98556.1 hypothetical protein VIBC2010_08413 [Vibrio caribbeanicus ATCC BAA-2122]
MKNKTILTSVLLASLFSTHTFALCSHSPLEGSWSSADEKRFVNISARCVTNEYGMDRVVYDIESDLGEASSYNVYNGEMTVYFPGGVQSIRVTSDSSVEIQTREIFTK